MRRHRQKIVTILLTIIVLLCIHRLNTISHALDPLVLEPANSTLGFGAIIALSAAHSPRRASLLWAANLTDLDIVIPPQPTWSDSDLANFRAEKGSSISNGSAKAWMGHTHVLKWFLSTTLSTALILEDDTDFSIHIRHTQIPLFARALHSILSSPQSPSTPNQQYYPHPSTYSLLYPGHCDDLPSPQTYTLYPHTTYADPTTPFQATLHPAMSHFLSTLRVPDSTRLVHRAKWPFCTFAYAVHRASAARIVKDFSREKEGGMSAFDVALLEACKDGDGDGDGGWKCWSVVPELFHHVVGSSEIGRVDGGGNRNGEDEVVGPRRATWNLGGCSARDEGLWVDEDDFEGRKAVRGFVGEMIRNGECVGTEWAENTWRGCEWDECGAQS